MKCFFCSLIKRCIHGGGDHHHTLRWYVYGGERERERALFTNEKKISYSPIKKVIDRDRRERERERFHQKERERVCVCVCE